MINSNNSNNSNIKSTSENNKSFLYNNFKNKNLLNSTNKVKQILPQKCNNNYKIILNKKYSNEYNNINNNFYGMSLRNNNIMNQNRKNKKFQINNFYSNTNIYETNNKTIRDQIFSIPPQNIGIKPSKLSYEKKIKNNNKNNNNRINKFKSFNGAISSTYNKIYQNTEVNKIKNELISSSSSSDISNNLSALAEDIINIYKTEKRKKKEKKFNKKLDINFNINKNLEKVFDSPKKEKTLKKEEKNKNNESTEENFDIINEIINKADLEEKNKKGRKIKFDFDKNVYINYNQKEKILTDNKKMDFYYTLLKSKIKIDSIIKNFDKKEIKINKEYELNENLEEYEILGDLYNIFYLKDINDLDKKLKQNIDCLVKKE